ncbi:hypothetical protein Cylst_5338 [Cylindrospermum stagnale PCC 7417]|uniref:Uncharacterized protein n=1 Tax=Cylindrospermum stagnale PCC 7417 TaxID=56107 RepID=K9X4G5_9NOST|nr:hypothetical protein [Cylindrospermum stagnale]AFZ27363.1 hypothetical protein Cylst_5338 [Cylindrospermum stagnale PCC 7417]
MATIKLSELQIAGSELFQDSESFINELNDVASVSVHGGGHDSGFSDYGHFGADFGKKYLEYLVNGYAVSTIKEIAKSYSESDDSYSNGYY